MSQFQEAIHRDTILLVGFPREATFSALEKYEKEYGKKLKLLVLGDKRRLKTLLKKYTYKMSKDTTLVSCDFDDAVEIRKAIEPFKDSLLAVTTHFEKTIPDLKAVIPHVPYLNAPSSESLDWASDKVKMRRLLDNHDSNLTPKFLVAKDASKATLDRIEKRIGFPVIIKPAGLAASMLVSACYHREELEESLTSAFKKLKKVYEKELGRGEPTMLVEQIMEGTQYSVDGYVNNRGVVYFVPPVHVKTGKAIGVDDYYGYQQLTPTKLKSNAIDELNAAGEEAVKALGLRSTIVHIELMLTDGEWKIIELAPRQGGFRHELYNMAFGINHILNDILIRVPQKPIIPKKRKGFAAVLKIYPKTEGKMTTIKGIIKLRALESFQKVDVHKEKGDRVIFARNGGASVMDIYLFNPDRSKLLADIRRIEKNLEIVVAGRKKS